MYKGSVLELMPRIGPGVVFAGGGSGGHLVPGLDLAEEIRRLDGRGRFLFLCGRRRVEGLVLARAPGATCRLPGLRPPRGVGGRLRFAATLPVLLGRTMQILRRFEADTVIGLGGYGAVPAVLAGRALGLRVVLLEQNVRPGLATRLLGPLAEAVCCAHPATAREFPNGRATGSPVRHGGGGLGRGAACRRFGLASHRLTLLVVGGSQGARGLNRLVCAHLGGLTRFRDALQVLHVAGEADREGVEAAYGRFGLRARVFPFLPDMPTAYRAADVVLSRAGGTTLAELALAGLPSVLVPYPHHRDRHQFLNARIFAAAGAAFVLTEQGANPATFGATVGVLLGDRRLRARMASAASGLARPGAGRRIAELVLEGRGRPPSRPLAVPAAGQGRGGRS